MQNARERPVVSCGPADVDNCGVPEPVLEGDNDDLKSVFKSRMRGHVIGVMTCAWALSAPMLPAARPCGRLRKLNIRAVLNAIFYTRASIQETRAWSP